VENNWCGLAPAVCCGTHRKAPNLVVRRIELLWSSYLWAQISEESFISVLKFKTMTAPISLQITIVGAGLGGLAAATCLAQKGYSVQVIESNNGLSELGAGIQVPPNAMRVLDSWGLKSILYREGNANDGATVRRYNNGKMIGMFRGNPLELYGYQ
jgi:hypothetical protein